MPRRYRADPHSLRRTLALDDGMTLLFHRPSATTHVVVTPVPEILDALEKGPADAGEVAERLAMKYDVDDAEAVAAHLAELSRAGLILEI